MKLALFSLCLFTLSAFAADVPYLGRITGTVFTTVTASDTFEFLPGKLGACETLSSTSYLRSFRCKFDTAPQFNFSSKFSITNINSVSMVVYLPSATNRTGKTQVEYVFFGESSRPLGTGTIQVPTRMRFFHSLEERKNLVGLLEMANRTSAEFRAQEE